MNLPVFMAEDPGSICFSRVCYQKKGKHHGEIKSSWKKRMDPNKKRHLSTSIWIFYPIGISPRKKSIEPKDQKYIFLMKYYELDRREQKKQEFSYAARIETAFDGSILEKFIFENSDSIPSSHKFNFPKNMLSKINRCLAHNFWYDLWNAQGGGYRGNNYAAWDKIDGGISRYMLTREYEWTSYTDSLLALLKSDRGNEAAILLAFTCFSVMKPFFPQYHSLDKTSSYLQAKKYIPKQIAINIQSDSLEAAVQLADLCCGCFDPDVFHTDLSNRKRRKPLVKDGIVIQYSPKEAYLSVDSFEATVLQSACVLWVNSIMVPLSRPK